jgi:predicted RNA-binding Zn-ribbon protein involved in translation (DUF1610 family)
MEGHITLGEFYRDYDAHCLDCGWTGDVFSTVIDLDKMPPGILCPKCGGFLYRTKKRSTDSRAMPSIRRSPS